MKDFTIAALVLKLVCLEASRAEYKEPIGRATILVLIAILLLLRLVHAAYTYRQAKSFPINWQNGSIKKLRKGKGDSARWKDTSISSLAVGDVVRLKYCNICPADLLVLDTSEQRYRENILKVNQRKIQGENRAKIRRAVRELGIRSTGQAMSQKEYLAKLCKKLNGYIEYEPPCGTRKRFSGIFKLKNDPKVSHLSDDNLLLAGSKLYSNE
jgi:magnesium-transporting ATPase (P-type)